MLDNSWLAYWEFIFLPPPDLELLLSSVLKSRLHLFTIRSCLVLPQQPEGSKSEAAAVWLAGDDGSLAA